MLGKCTCFSTAGDSWGRTGYGVGFVGRHRRVTAGRLEGGSFLCFYVQHRSVLCSFFPFVTAVQLYSIPACTSGFLGFSRVPPRHRAKEPLVS